LGYKFGIAQEKGFLTGSGANQPLGVFTADANGISTARDVTMAGSTAITADDFINTKYSLKSQYMGTAHWILHRDVVKAARKLKDANNNYIWTTGLGPGGGFQGTPEQILDRPFHMSEYAPNTFTTGKYIGIFGDFSRYVIATALDMQIQVLDQLYAETNQTGYIGRLEVDGMPVLEEAFARMKLA
ncbi:MAG: Phage capsid family protein, partial [Capsulimonas sp.]|nr:Phage capsid family protein [Capsulimonas sp.]